MNCNSESGTAGWPACPRPVMRSALNLCIASCLVASVITMLSRGKATTAEVLRWLWLS
jgi:hypothetical protein